MFRSYGICAVVCALFVTACGGGGNTSGTGGSDGSGGAGGATTGGDTTTGGGAATVESACAAFAKATCDKITSCAPFLADVGFSDAATCASRGAIQCKAELSAPEASKTNAAKFATCATKIMAATCGEILGGALPAECRPDPGTLADGKACGGDAQCANVFCKKGEDGSCGVCATKVAAGGACAAAGDCADGLGCNGGKCSKPGALGDACSDMQPCNLQLACASGKCIASGKLGDACSGAFDSCDFTAGLLCGPVSKKCDAIKTAKAGEACGFISNAVVVCAGGSTCNNGMQPMGTCVAPAADGAMCDEAKSIGCLSGASCTKGVCTVADPALCK